MPTHDIIVVGASAGGIPAFREIARALPADLPASVLVVFHIAAGSPGVLAQLIDAAGPLHATFARDGELIQKSRIYIAPPDHHLLVKDGVLSLGRGPKENGFRPAVDPLFRSAAQSCGNRVVGVVLSGGLSDGTAGLGLIKRLGGLAIVQQPETAESPGMPASAIRHVAVDHIVPLWQIPALLAELAAATETGPRRAKRRGASPGVAHAAEDDVHELPGAPSGFVCPECGGALWEVRQERLGRFRCHVGHVYTLDALGAEQSRMLENALWTALRALNEQAALKRRLARRVEGGPLPAITAELERQAEDADRGAAAIRAVLVNSGGRKESVRNGRRPRSPTRARATRTRAKQGGMSRKDGVAGRGASKRQGGGSPTRGKRRG